VTLARNSVAPWRCSWDQTCWSDFKCFSMKFYICALVGMLIKWLYEMHGSMIKKGALKFHIIPSRRYPIHKPYTQMWEKQKCRINNEADSHSQRYRTMYHSVISPWRPDSSSELRIIEFHFQSLQNARCKRSKANLTLHYVWPIQYMCTYHNS